MNLFDVLALGEPTKRATSPRELQTGILRAPKNQVDQMADAAWGAELKQSVMPEVRWLGDALMEQSPAIQAGMQEQASNVPVGLMAGIFGGMNSKTFPQEMLSKAGAMLNRGESDELIRKHTGLFKGADNKIRYEIDDSLAAFKQPWKNIIGSRGRLGDMLDHPELFEAYPLLRNLEVRTDKSLGLEAGNFSPSNWTIRLDPALGSHDAMRTLLHEIQHGVQNVEGFARGAGSASLDYLDRPQNRAALHDYLQDIARKDPELSAHAKENLELLDEWVSRNDSDVFRKVTQEYNSLDNDYLTISKYVDMLKDKNQALVNNLMEIQKKHPEDWHLTREYKQLKKTKDEVDNNLEKAWTKMSDIAEARNRAETELGEIMGHYAPLSDDIYRLSLGEAEANSAADRWLLDKQARNENRPRFLDFRHYLVDY